MTYHFLHSFFDYFSTYFLNSDDIVPKKAVFQQNGAYSRLNTARSQLNGTRSQLNRSYSRLNPSCSQLNGTCNQLNRTRSQLNRSRSQLNRSRSQLNPSCDQLCPSYSQLNQIDKQRPQMYRAPLLIPFGIPTQVFFSDKRHQKRSLASPNEYFGNRVKVRWTFEPACAEARKKPKLGNKMELLEVPYSDPHCSGGLRSFIWSWWSPQPGDTTYCYTDHKLSRLELKYKASILTSNTVIKFNKFCCLQDHIPLLGGARGVFWKKIQMFRSTHHIHWINTIPPHLKGTLYPPQNHLKACLSDEAGDSSPPQSHLKGTLRKTEYNWGEIRYNTNVLSGQVKQKYCITDYPVGNTYGRFNYFNTIEYE